MAPSPPRRRPTRRQLEVLRTYIVAGSIAAAAYELDISETTLGNTCRGCTGGRVASNAAQAAYWLGRQGTAAWTRSAMEAPRS